MFVRETGTKPKKTRCNNDDDRSDHAQLFFVCYVLENDLYRGYNMVQFCCCCEKTEMRGSSSTLALNWKRTWPLEGDDTKGDEIERERKKERGREIGLKLFDVIRDWFDSILCVSILNLYFRDNIYFQYVQTLVEVSSRLSVPLLLQAESEK